MNQVELSAGLARGRFVRSRSRCSTISSGQRIPIWWAAMSVNSRAHSVTHSSSFPFNQYMVGDNIVSHAGRGSDRMTHTGKKSPTGGPGPGNFSQHVIPESRSQVTIRQHDNEPVNPHVELRCVQGSLERPKSAGFPELDVPFRNMTVPIVLAEKSGSEFSLPLGAQAPR